jgi:hypothetical protein
VENYICFFKKSLKIEKALGIVVQACNPRYLGGRDWKDGGLMPAQTKSYQDPISTKSTM